jgi:hypothetical protein
MSRVSTVRAPTESEVLFDPKVPQDLRELALLDSSLSCRMCGIAPGDLDECKGAPARFYIELSASDSVGIREAGDVVHPLCSTCHEGVKELKRQKPTTIWLLSQIRRAGVDEQRAVLKWLRTKFKEI